MIETQLRLPALIRLIIWLIQIILTLLVPVLLVLLGVRLALSEAWLNFEYNRAGFPEDLYGWEKDVRLEYGPYGIRYLMDNEDIAYLAALEIEGEPAFNRRELQHMEDVQVVVIMAMQVLAITLIIFVGGAGALGVWRGTRSYLLRALSNGGVLTIALAFTLMMMAIISWDFFFDNFHALFFEGDSWQFSRSDTLIRLYPQQFWFDSSLLVGFLTLGGALLLAFLPRWRLRKTAAKARMLHDKLTEI